MLNNIKTSFISVDQHQKENEPFTINEIIGRPPGWILRSGMTVLFIVVAIGIAMTFIIRYPDKIQATGVITTADPSKPIVTRSSGVVDTVFVENQQLVSEDQSIFYIQNTADRKDVQKVMQQIENFDNKMTLYNANFTFNNADFSLGPLQSSFASLVQQVKEYRHFLSRDDYALKLNAIDREIEEIHFLDKVLEQEKGLTEDEVSLSKKDMERNQELFDNGIISEREMEQSQAGHIGIRKSYLLKDNNMAQNRIRIAGLNQQKIDIQAARNEQLLLYQSRISEIILNLRNLYNNWHQQYFVEAPANGIVQLSSDIVAGQTVPVGKSIGHVIPESSNRIGDKEFNPKYAKIYVPSAGIGKIEKGNRAIIRIEAYPYKEFGTIDSRVEEIYPIAEVKENGARIYEIHLPLDSVLITDYGNSIHYSPEMPVQVAIIAKERSLFERIFDQFLNLLKTHTRTPQLIEGHTSLGRHLSTTEEQSRDYAALTYNPQIGGDFVSLFPPQSINYKLHTKN